MYACVRSMVPQKNSLPFFILDIHAFVLLAKLKACTELVF